MEENTSKALTIGISVLLTCAVLSTAFYFFLRGKNIAYKVSENSDKLTNMSVASKYVKYDDTVVDGSDVLNAISEFATNEFTINVKTSASATSKSYNAYNSYKITDINSNYYIEPTAKFESKLGRNVNGTVCKITFTPSS